MNIYDGYVMKGEWTSGPQRMVIVCEIVGIKVSGQFCGDGYSVQLI